MASCSVWLKCDKINDLFNAKEIRPYLEDNSESPSDYGVYYESAFAIDVNDSLTLHDCYFLLNDTNCYPIGYQSYVLGLSHMSFAVRIFMCSIFLLLLLGGQVLSVLVINAFRKQFKCFSKLFESPFAVIMVLIMACNILYQLGLQCFVCTVLVYGHNNEMFFKSEIMFAEISYLLMILTMILMAFYEINVLSSFLLSLNRLLIFFNGHLNRAVFSPTRLIILNAVIWIISIVWGIIYYTVLTCQINITYFSYYMRESVYLDQISAAKCNWSNLGIHYFHIFLITAESLFYTAIFIKLNWEKILSFIKRKREIPQTMQSTSRRRDINILYQCLIIFFTLLFENGATWFNELLFDTQISDDDTDLHFGNFATAAVDHNYGLLLDVTSIFLLMVRISRSIMHAVMVLIFNAEIREIMAGFVSKLPSVSFITVSAVGPSSMVRVQ